MQLIQKPSKLNPKAITISCGNCATCSQNKFDSMSHKIGWVSGNCHLFIYIKNTGCQASITDNKNILSLAFFTLSKQELQFQYHFIQKDSERQQFRNSSKTEKENYCTLILLFRFLAFSINTIKASKSISAENITHMKEISLFKISPWDIYYSNNRYECFGIIYNYFHEDDPSVSLLKNSPGKTCS